MFVNQQRVIPRWKEWKPLASQQFRLRSLIQIIGINVGAEDLNGKNNQTPVDKEQSSGVLYYYTLHKSALSTPFYTSEKLESNFPRWKEIDADVWTESGAFGGAQGFVLRLWCHRDDVEKDENMTSWGVHLTGLAYLGTHLSGDTVPVASNTIIFMMPGGYYTMMTDEGRTKVSRLSASKSDLRQSYHMQMVHRLTAIQKTVVQKLSQVEIIKLKIASGNFITSDSRRSATIRRIRNESRQEINQEEVMKLKERIELAKFFSQTLEKEKSCTEERIARLKSRLETLCDSNQLKESKTMENYGLLAREMKAHREWLVGHNDRREAQIHARAQLNFRIKQLISELQLIYPIARRGDKLTICGVHLPDSENFAGCTDLQVSVGLGFVAHTVQMASTFTLVPLRYPIIHYGSRSRILDLIVDKVPDAEREFPLYSMGNNKLQFGYAVYLLNKNIAGLRWLHGLGTTDLRCTLPNLEDLLRLGETDEPPPMSPPMETARSSFSVSSPIQSHSCPRHFNWHRFSKSANTTTPVAPLAVDVTNPLTNNLSCSLDKGLNEFRQRERNAQTLETELYLPSTNLPSGGSESHLPFVPKNTSGLLSVAEDATTSDYLQAWHLEKRAIFSDTDSDQNYPRVVTEHAENSLNDDEDENVSVGQEASDVPVEINHEKFPEESQPARNVLSPVAIGVGADALLDYVTDRTEALANHATSFNMCRSRFRSTQEESE